MSLDVRSTVQAAGDVGVLTREQKEARGLVPQPVELPGVEPLRWADCRLIAEIGGVNNLSMAKDMCLKARLAGFWAVKVQMLHRGTLTSRTAVSYGLGVKQADTQWEDFAEHGLNFYDLASLRDYCNELHLLLFASCWDENTVDQALDLGFPLLKIGSGDITHEWLLRYIGNCGVPVILSTGASYLWEVERALDWLAPAPRIILAACTLAYPCPAEDANLRRISILREAFPRTLVGYSDHCAEPEMIGEAKRAGAAFVEVHWTITPGAGGDHDFAVHPDNIGRAFDPLSGDHQGSYHFGPVPVEDAARLGARRSLAANAPISKGDRFRLWDLIALRPGDGVPPYDLASLVGLKASRNYEAGEIINPPDIP